MSLPDLVALDGSPLPASRFAGKTLLIVNVASKCGLTPQYTALEALQKKYAAKGFSVVGFPCNQFGGQEPGSADEIGTFCSTRFAVTFPVFEKVEVNGGGAHPLFEDLKREAPGLLGSESIKWNFTKFLVGRDGKVIRRFAPTDRPEAIEPAIVTALSAM